MYTIREVCAKLGLAYITVWQWVKQGKIKAVRVELGRLELPRR
jgi:excisionase family DNA binding protein